nr:MAG TPA: hypothetical protein [Caudoviricetes sp.]
MFVKNPIIVFLNEYHVNDYYITEIFISKNTR